MGKVMLKETEVSEIINVSLPTLRRWRQKIGKKRSAWLIAHG